MRNLSIMTQPIQNKKARTEKTKKAYLPIKNFMILPFLICSLALMTAQQKGVTEIAKARENNTAGQTYAVVFGVSDYQSPKIPDLQYADKDALAFVEWLKSSEGLQISEDNIKLYTNETATTAQLDVALDWLLEKCKTGDKAFFYFSGHGDAENSTRSKRGFLLCYDSPPNNYAAGAYGLIYFQDKISTLSLENNAKVIVILDACRAGKLAGSQNGGTQATAAELAQQYGNEIKLLSCQPDENSIEGRQWGNGRGVFSYYLTDGLYGLADGNKDDTISLLELGRYLQDKIRFDIDPIPQTPMIIGRSGEKISTVNHETLATYQKSKQAKSQIIYSYESRNIEEQALALADSQTRRKYELFKIALRSGNYFSTDSLCANALFESLINNPELKLLHNTMKRNFAVALQDEVQQALNALLSSEAEELASWKYYPEKYALYPSYLSKAMELIGSKNKYYNTLLAKKIYFESYLTYKNVLLQEKNNSVRDSLRQKLKADYLLALRLDSSAAFIYKAIGELYFLNIPNKIDSVLYWNKLAIELSPSWLLPYLEIAEEYQVSFSNRFQESEEWLQKALQIDSQSYIIKERLAWLYQRKNQTEKTIELALEIVKQKPHLPNGYFTLLNTYAFRREFEKMKYHFEKLDSMNIVENHMAPYFLKTRKSGFFIPYFKKWFESDQIPLETKNNYAACLAFSYESIGKKDQARKYIDFCDANPAYYWFYLDILCLKGKNALSDGKINEADSLFKVAQHLDPTTPNYCKSLAWQGVVAEKRGDVTKADSFFQLAIHRWLGSAWDDFYLQEECHFLYGMFLIRQKRYDDAKTMFLKANEYAFQNGYLGWYGLACLESSRRNEKLAFHYLKKTLDADFPVRADLENEALLQSISKSKKFKTLLDQSFNMNLKFYNPDQHEK